MKHLDALILVTGISLANLGCEIDPAEYEYGNNIIGLEFTLFSETTGVHPNKDVLIDPNNPFRESGVGLETKWDIQSDGGNVGAFDQVTGDITLSNATATGSVGDEFSLTMKKTLGELGFVRWNSPILEKFRRYKKYIL